MNTRTIPFPGHVEETIEFGDEPLLCDIRFGRGKPINRNPGNVWFRTVIALHFKEYERINKVAKNELSRKIVADVKGTGRKFWKQVDTNICSKYGNTIRRWVPVEDDEECRQKVAITFRCQRKIRQRKLSPEQLDAETQIKISLRQNKTALRQKLIAERQTRRLQRQKQIAQREKELAEKLLAQREKELDEIEQELHRKEQLLAQTRKDLKHTGAQSNKDLADTVNSGTSPMPRTLAEVEYTNDTNSFLSSSISPIRIGNDAGSIIVTCDEIII